MQNKTNKKGFTWAVKIGLPRLRRGKGQSPYPISTAGFTLIEMLVVISVIAILSGITLTGIASFTSRARDTQRIGDLRNIQPHLELFFNKCGHYPGFGDPSSASGCGDLSPSGWDWDEFKNTMETAVGARIPEDPLPAPARTYYYAYEDNGFEYILGAELENDNNALRNDIDGIPSDGDWTPQPGMTCTSSDLQYCIGS